MSKGHRSQIKREKCEYCKETFSYSFICKSIRTEGMLRS